MSVITTSGPQTARSDRRKLRVGMLAASTAAVAIALMAGCVASPEPPAAIETSRPSATESSTTTPVAPTPTPTSTSQPVPTEETSPVTFTFECYIPDPTAPGGGNCFPYDTMEAAWENPDILSCKGTRHGEIITEAQQAAIAVAGPAFASDDPYTILEGLYSQCATVSNGYLTIDKYTGFQDEDVRGILAICPHHPGADKLRAGLPSK